ncbi:MAG: hypothetical protein ABIK10_01780 [candidate division WOR-3 bacterium]
MEQNNLNMVLTESQTVIDTPYEPMREITDKDKIYYQEVSLEKYGLFFNFGVQ